MNGLSAQKKVCMPGNDIFEGHLQFATKQVFRSKDVSDDIQIKRSYPVGLYAYGIEWDDGHSSMYTLSRLSQSFV